MLRISNHRGASRLLMSSEAAPWRRLLVRDRPSVAPERVGQGGGEWVPRASGEELRGRGRGRAGGQRRLGWVESLETKGGGEGVAQGGEIVGHPPKSRAYRHNPSGR